MKYSLLRATAALALIGSVAGMALAPSAIAATEVVGSHYGAADQSQLASRAGSHDEAQLASRAGSQDPAFNQA